MTTREVPLEKKFLLKCVQVSVLKSVTMITMRGALTREVNIRTNKIEGSV